MKKPSLIMRFFSFLLKAATVLALMAVIAIASFEGVTYYLTGSLYDLRKIAERKDEINTSQNETEVPPEIDETNMRNTLFFVDGADGKEYIALNMLNTKSYVLDILLIPENAQVTVGKDVLKQIQKEMPDSKNTVNISDIAHAFGDEKHKMITDILENVTGVEIAGSDAMTEDDFMKFLDMAGTVEYQMDNNISYRDAKGNLEELSADLEELDGEQAMELLTYLDGSETQESARLERTSIYLEAFFEKLFEENKSSVIYKKYTNLIQSSEDRDLSEEEKIFENLDSERITIRILQGAEANNIFTVDSQKVQLQIAALASQAEEVDGAGRSADGDDDDGESQSAGASAAEDSKDHSIELYNAAYVAGLAGEWEAYLEEEGYNISLVDSYQDEGPISSTRIIVTEEGMGEDLLEYFPDASIEVDEIDTGGDIQVYIGTDATSVGDGTEDEDMDADGDTTEEDNDGEDREEDAVGDGGTSGSGGSYSFDTDSE